MHVVIKLMLGAVLIVLKVIGIQFISDLDQENKDLRWENQRLRKDKIDRLEEDKDE